MDGVPQTVAPLVTTRQHGEAAVTGLSFLVDELVYGVVLVGANGRVLHANAAARREWTRPDLISMQDGCLQATSPEQQRLLLQALGKAQSGRRSLVTLRCEIRRLSIAVLPLRRDRAGNGPAAALLFSRPAVCDAVMLCFFARAHGLTPSEEQVLAILCQGYSAPQAAVLLKVAVSTVRSHVRSLCTKTQCKGVRALVGQVAVLPPMAAACLQDPLH